MPSWIGNLPPQVWQDGAPWLLVFLIIVLLVTGRLVTRSQLRDHRQSWDSQASELRQHAEDWHKLAVQSQQLGTETAAVSRELLDQQAQLLAGMAALRQALASVSPPSVVREGAGPT